MAAYWTQCPTGEAGQDNQPLGASDPRFAVSPASDDRQVLEQLRISRVILRVDIIELAKATYRALESSTSNTRTLIELRAMFKQRQAELRKLDGQIQSLIDIHSFENDLEECEPYMYTICHRKALLHERIPRAASRKSGVATKTSWPPAHIQRPPRAGAFQSKDAASGPLPFAVRAAFEPQWSSPSLRKMTEQHSAPIVSTSSVNQGAEGSGSSDFAEGATVTASCRSQDDAIQGTYTLEANARKTSSMDNTKFNGSADDQPSGLASNESKTFARVPSFRNSAPVTPKIKTLVRSDLDARVFRNQVAALPLIKTSRCSPDAGTEVTGNDAINEQLDRFMTSGPETLMRAGSDSGNALRSPSGDELLESKSRSVSIKTRENVALAQPPERSNTGSQSSVQTQMANAQSVCEGEDRKRTRKGKGTNEKEIQAAFRRQITHT